MSEALTYDIWEDLPHLLDPELAQITAACEQTLVKTQEHLDQLNKETERRQPKQAALFLGSLAWNNNHLDDFPVANAVKPLEKPVKPQAGHWVLRYPVELGWVKYNPESTDGGW